MTKRQKSLLRYLKPREKKAVHKASTYLTDLYGYPDYISDVFIQVDKTDNYYIVCVIEDGYDRENLGDIPENALTMQLELSDFEGEVAFLSIYKLYIIPMITLLVDYYKGVIAENAKFENIINLN